MGRKYANWAVVFSIAATSGCLTPMSDALTSSIAATSSVSTTASASGDAYLKVETAWEGDPDTFETHGTCTLATSSALRTETCTIRIPEGQLRFSKVKFTYGTANASLCQRVVFTPSYYIASDSDPAFLDYWSESPSAVDCTDLDGNGRPTEAGCYWGAGPRLIDDFPNYTSHYITTAEGLESSDTLDSENESDESIAGTNLGVCNKYDTPAVPITSGLQSYYVANSLTPYKVTCLDKYEQTLGTVNVYIADDDLSTGQDPGVPASDQYYDWAEAL